MTYRLADDGHFVARSHRLTSILNSVASAARWNEPPTFCMFKSKLEIDELANRFRPAIEHEKDVILLSMTEFKEARILGCPSQVALYALMPFAKEA